MSLKRWYGSLDEEFRNKLVTSVLVGGLISILFLIVFGIKDWDMNQTWTNNLKSLALNLVLSTIIFLLVTLAVDYISLLNTFPRLLDRKFDKRLSMFMEYFALGTENRRFEEAIDLVRSTNGRIQWIIAKFVSKKLSKEFDTSAYIEIKDVNIVEYSQFISQIVSESEYSMKWTCPYSPAEWFKKLEPDEYNDWKKQKRELEIDVYPQHLKAFVQSCVPKQRLVNLTSEQYKALLNEENRWDFEQFVKFADASHRLEMRFVNTNSLTETLMCKNSDYAVFDDGVVIEWDKNPTNENVGTLRLFSRGRDKFLDPFSYWNDSRVCHSIEDVRKKLHGGTKGEKGSQTEG